MKALYSALTFTLLLAAGCSKDEGDPIPEISQSFVARDTAANSKGSTYNNHNSPFRVDYFERRDSSIEMTKFVTRYWHFIVNLRFARPLDRLATGNYRIVNTYSGAEREVVLTYRYYDNPKSMRWQPSDAAELVLGRDTGKLWVSVPGVTLSPMDGGAVLRLEGSAREK